MDTDEDDLLSIPNTIYQILGQEKELKSEDELYSDEVYLDIISILLPNIDGEITPGKTPEEKIETLSLLLSLLGKLLEADLDIDPKKIVLEHDRENAKNFLEILLRVTTSLLNSGAELEEEEDEFEENKMNISDPRMKYNDESLESLRLGKDKIKDKSEKKNTKKKEENMGGFDKEKSQSGEIIFNKEDDNNIDNLDNLDKNEEKKNNSDIDDEIIRKNTDEENINITNENNELINSEKKTYDIPGLLEGEIVDEKNKSKSINKSKSKSNIELDNENDNENDLEEEEYNLKKNKYDFGNLNNSDDDNSSMNNKLANSVPQPMDKPMLTNNNSSEDYIDLRKNQKSKEKKDEDDFDYNYNDELDEKNNSNSNSNTSNMNISLHSKKSKSKNRQNIIDASNSKFKDSSNKKIEGSTTNKKQKNKINNNNTGSMSNNNKNNKTNKKSSKKQSGGTTSKKNNLTESQSNMSSNNDISKSSVYTNSLRPAPNPHEKKLGIGEKKNNLEPNSRKSTIKTKSKSSSTSIINSEIPLDTQGFKFELIKELKKLYGKKIGKVLQGPNNSYSNLDIVLQEFKLAKKQEKLIKKSMKSQNTTKNDKIEKNSASKSNANLSSEEPILTRDFLLKNERLLQLMLQICDQKLKNKKAEQEHQVREIGQNLSFMRKLKFFESKKLENEIQNKKFFYKNNNNFFEEQFFCQKVYEEFYRHEAEKCAREIESMTLINAMKMEEKANNISEIDKYYRNKIAILNEIGRREKEENLRRNMEDEFIYYQLNQMPKKELKKKMKMILDTIDDEIYMANDEAENNNNQNNQKEIEKILDNY